MRGRCQSRGRLGSLTSETCYLSTVSHTPQRIGGNGELTSLASLSFARLRLCLSLPFSRSLFFFTVSSRSLSSASLSLHSPILPPPSLDAPRMNLVAGSFWFRD